MAGVTLNAALDKLSATADGKLRPVLTPCVAHWATARPRPRLSAASRTRWA